MNQEPGIRKSRSIRLLESQVETLISNSSSQFDREWLEPVALIARVFGEKVLDFRSSILLCNKLQIPIAALDKKFANNPRCAESYGPILLGIIATVAANIEASDEVLFDVTMTEPLQEIPLSGKSSNSLPMVNPPTRKPMLSEREIELAESLRARSSSSSGEMHLARYSKTRMVDDDNEDANASDNDPDEAYVPPQESDNDSGVENDTAMPMLSRAERHELGSSTAPTTNVESRVNRLETLIGQLIESNRQLTKVVITQRPVAVTSLASIPVSAPPAVVRGTLPDRLPPVVVPIPLAAASSTTGNDFSLSDALYLDSIRLSLYEGNDTKWLDTKRPKKKADLPSFYPRSRRDQSSLLAMLCMRCVEDQRHDLVALLLQAIATVNLTKHGPKQDLLKEFTRTFFTLLKAPFAAINDPKSFISQVFEEAEPTKSDSDSDLLSDSSDKRKRKPKTFVARNQRPRNYQPWTNNNQSWANNYGGGPSNNSWTDNVQHNTKEAGKGGRVVTSATE